MFKRLSQKLHPPFPREHGAWAMFAVPLIVGVSAARTVKLDVALFALTAFGFFLLRYPLMLALRARAPSTRTTALQWSVVYALFTGVCGIVLLVMTQLVALYFFAALGFVLLTLYLVLTLQRAEMSTLGEWIGVAGLALGAPGAYLVATRALDATAFALYGLNILYFGGTISYIKFKVREQPRMTTASTTMRARVWAGRVTLAYHLIVITLLTLAAVLGFLPLLAPIAFVLPLGKVIGGVLTRPARVNLPRLGLIELGLTLVFALVIVWAYH